MRVFCLLVLIFGFYITAHDKKEDDKFIYGISHGSEYHKTKSYYEDYEGNICFTDDHGRYHRVPKQYVNDITDR